MTNLEIIGLWLAMIIVATIIDYIVGDPFGSFHPIVLIGHLISFLTKRLNRGRARKLKGLVLAIIVILSTLLTIWSLQFLLRDFFSLSIIVNIWFLSTALAEKSLREAGQKIVKALKADNLQEARKYTGYVVGRDTSVLNIDGILRATVETTAENGIDGILAPLMMMVLGAFFSPFLPLLNPLVLVYLYKSINTMDSMVGYIDEPYTDFGYFPAKLDDLMNFIPARVGSWFYLLAGRILALDVRLGKKIYKRDKNNHTSPNAGHPESCIAGMLGIQLGGNSIYFGNLHKKETIGDQVHSIKIEDIKTSMSVVFIAEVLFLSVTLLLYSLLWIRKVY